MSKVLYITANPKAEEKSFSLQVGRAFIEAYKAANPMDEVTEIDVYKENIPMIDYDVMGAWDKLQAGVDWSELSSVEQEKVGAFGALTDQFVAADKYVFVTPFWNFTMPAMMKAYLDTACVANKTFKYTEAGPVGMLEGKKALHIQASGGVYSEGPLTAVEFGNAYLKTVCGFIGIQDFNTVFVEGIAIDPSKAEEIKEAAINKALDVVKTF